MRRLVTGSVTTGRKQFLECGQHNSVERDVSRLTALCPMQSDDLSCQRNGRPLQTPLLAGPHPGMHRDEERGKIARPVFADHGDELRFFPVAQETILLSLVK